MSYEEKSADNSKDVYFGIEWNESNSGSTFSIKPKIYRWDRYDTNNSGGRWSEDLTEPSGSSGSWSGLSFGSGSGYRVIDSFAERKYSKSHSTSTIYYHLYTDASFGTYSNGFKTLGAQTWTFLMTIPAKASYSVSYNKNGGGTAPSAQTKWYDEDLTLRGAITDRTNYVFKNWNTKADGTGTAYAAGAKYTGNAALTLYAQWYAPYTVSFNANNGSGAPGNQTKVYNTTLKLSTTKPTRTGYTFKGWATTQARANAGTVDYSSGANYTTNASATLYAVWQINTWSVTYDGNGATGGSTASQTKTYGQTLTLQSNGFTKTNHNFVKWNTAANGSGTSYNAGASYTGNAALKLYAQWEIAHASPTISALAVKRCTSDGTESVEGDRMKVEAQWSVDNTTEGFEDTVGATFKVTLGGTTDTVNLSGTSGTVSFVHSATAAIGTSYRVTSVLADSKGFETTRTSTLSVAYFTMHFKKGGTGVGIGKPSTEDNLLDVGMPTKIAGKVTALGNVQAQCYLILRANESNYSGIRTIPNGSAGRSTDAIRFYGTTDNADGDEIDIGNGGQVIVGSGESASNLHTALNAAVGSEQLYLGSDGHVYLFSHCQTIANRTQLMLYNSASVALYGRCGADHTVALGNTSNNGVTATTGIGSIVYQDKNGSWAGSSGTEVNGSAGNVRSYIGARNIKTDGTAVTNYLCVDVNKDGTPNYSVSSPTNFRTAIGANSASNLSTGTVPAERLTHVGWTYLVGSATAAFYVRWCKVANIVHVEVLGSKSLSSGTNTSVGTITSGSRPSKEVDSFLYLSTNNVGVLWVTADGAVYIKSYTGAASTIYGFLSYPVI